MRFFFLLLCVMCTSAMAEDLIASKKLQPLSQADIVRYAAFVSPQGITKARFSQRKLLPSFTKPLDSSGEFILTEDSRLLWKTTKPFDMVTRFSAQGMTHWVGREKQPRNPNIDRNVRRLFTHISALLSGDFLPMQKAFEVFGKEENGYWMVGFRPKSTHVKRYLKSLLLEGEEQIAAITIEEAGGQKTTMRFSQYQLNLKALSDEDRRYFEE